MKIRWLKYRRMPRENEEDENIGRVIKESSQIEITNPVE